MDKLIINNIEIIDNNIVYLVVKSFPSDICFSSIVDIVAKEIAQPNMKYK
tara:strand:- start:193 stop:342 length:150 start_codon:yes stop_codon:yes gene_type:complete